MASIAELRKDKKRFYSKNNLREVANTCNLLGTLLQEVGEHDLALKEHQEEASIFETLDDLIGVAIAHRRMGEVYCELGKWNKALKHQNMHLSLSKDVKSTVEQQRAYATIGRTHMQLAEEVAASDDKAKYMAALQDSQSAFFKALAVCDNISRDVDSCELAQMRARLYHNIGLVLDLKDDLSGALKFVSQALELCHLYNLTEDTYRAYSELSRMHLKLESVAKALEEAQLSLKLGVKLNNKRFIIDAHLLLAQIYLTSDDFLAARKSTYKAYKVKHPSKEVRDIVEKNLKYIVSLCIYQDEMSKLETNVETRLKNLDKIGDIFCNLGLFKKAITFYYKRLLLAQENKKEKAYLAPIYTSLAQSYKDDKQFEKSLEYFQKELDIHIDTNDKESVVTLLEMAKVSEMMTASKEKACHYYEQALQIATKANSSQLKIIALRNYVASSCVSSKKKEDLESELEALEDDDDTTVDFEENEDETEDEEVNLDLIEFSDSDEERAKIASRGSRISPGFRFKVNAMGETLLHQAIIKGNLSMVRRLIEQDHPVNVRDNSGWLPIHEACNWGHREIAEILIEAGAWINDRGGRECSGTSPLHDATINGHFEVIKLLIEKGASVTAKDIEGNTPLDCLAKFAQQCDESEIEDCEVVQTILIQRMERAGYKIPERLKVSFSQQKNCKSSTAQRTKNNRSNSLIDDDDLASVWGDDFGPSDTLGPSSTRNSAAETYKAAIKNVGSHAKKLDSARALSSSATSKDSITPLIPEEDYVREDWLVDDLAESENKKRKRSEKMEFEYKEAPRKKRNFDSAKPIHKKAKQSKLTALFKKNPSSSSSSSCNEDDDDIEVVRNVDSSRQYETSPRHFSSQSETSHHHSCHSPLRLHIKVLGQKLLVPLSSSAQRNTIRWLEQEVARRYFQLAGVKLILRLSTRQNEVLNPDDPIDLTLSTDNSQLQTTVSGIEDLPPLPERYTQSCQKLNLAPCEALSSRLKDCDSSGELNLSRSYLRNEKHLEAVLASLHHQNIQVLNLSSCRIEDAGMLKLIQCLSSLSLLYKLELEACSLTSESLEAFCGFLKSEDTSKKLSHVNLSYNNFCDANISHLRSLLFFPSLQMLNLNSCGIRLSDSDLGNQTSNIQILDLAENNLSLTAFSAIISVCPRLTHLSIHGCISTPKTTKKTFKFFDRPSMDSLHEPSLGTSLSTILGSGSECLLEHLDISSCSVTSQDVDVLSSYFYRCSSLKSLNLSGNPHVNSESLLKLVQEINRMASVSLKELKLHGIGISEQDHSLVEHLTRIIQKSASTQSFLTLSLPYSEVTKRLSQLELHDKSAIVKVFSKTLFLTLE